MSQADPLLIYHVRMVSITSCVSQTRKSIQNILFFRHFVLLPFHKIQLFLLPSFELPSFELLVSHRQFSYHVFVICFGTLKRTGDLPSPTGSHCATAIDAPLAPPSDLPARDILFEHQGLYLVDLDFDPFSFVSDSPLNQLVIKNLCPFKKPLKKTMPCLSGLSTLFYSLHRLQLTSILTASPEPFLIDA